MKYSMMFGLLFVVSLAIVASGCKDPGTPTTIADQQKLVRGSTPTPEQLQKAMSKYKFNSPGDKPVPMPQGPANGGR